MMKGNVPIVSTRTLLPGEIQTSDKNSANVPDRIKLSVVEFSDFVANGNMPDSRYSSVNAILIISATIARIIKKSDSRIMRSFD